MNTTNEQDLTRPEIHNSEINTVAAVAQRCGMTHLSSGRICLLPARHRGACEFQEVSALEKAIAESG